MDIDDLDWNLAARAGLTDRERSVLSYFADIEGQTAYYMLEVAKLEVARDPTLLTFLTLWNYEEMFHARAIHRVLEACGGAPLDDVERKHQVRASALLRARIEDAFQVALAHLAPETFTALWMAWGAAQELVTTLAYEQVARTTTNPVVRELFRRIAKQERRHFAWYHACARERLDGHRAGQWLVRRIFEHLWTPVGSGVKSPGEVAALIDAVFPGDVLDRCLQHVDQRLGALPGMDGLRACTRWAERFRAETAAVRDRCLGTPSLVPS